MNKSIKNYIKKNINSEETNDTNSDKNIISEEIEDYENSDDIIIMSNELNKKKNVLCYNNIKKNRKRHELS